MEQPKGIGENPFLGLRIAHLRRLRGLSQKQLGEAVGVTFQQIQKYEKGTNRIAAERLVAIAKKLGVSVNQLVAKDAPGTPNASALSVGLVDTPGSAELLLAYHKILSPEMRQAALAAVLAIAQTAKKIELTSKAAGTVKLALPKAA
ncbi:helix-turn-helix domain-containing protein [Methylobacterium organophilum]|uniref:helix-turn-helix domain-containing protein n=1 Tax=Methylobacterium organophilum TaxID=410 RepID=UPI001F1385AF|nr:helix-turn-helix transcriptional regulator [Methylobacterium organophilum]UMY18678.1 helix-turn-helix domain-containing protein [Methylobacterium organophilum]